MIWFELNPFTHIMSPILRHDISKPFYQHQLPKATLKAALNLLFFISLPFWIENRPALAGVDFESCYAVLLQGKEATTPVHNWATSYCNCLVRNNVSTSQYCKNEAQARYDAEMNAINNRNWGLIRSLTPTYAPSYTFPRPRPTSCYPSYNYVGVYQGVRCE